MPALPTLLVATAEDILLAFPERGTVERARGLDGRRPTCLAADPGHPERVWCGTVRDGVYRSEDGGASWRGGGLAGEHVTALAADPTGGDLLYAGTEPSSVRVSRDGGETWQRTSDLLELPSAPRWSFPPKPETHHVRWIACHPGDPDRLWVAIEAGALVRTFDGGATWQDRTPNGPYDTHELAVHSDEPETLRISAGDGYFESTDGGETWATPREGLEVGYLRSVAIDPGEPGTIVVSASSRARSAYVAGHSDGRLYRREGSSPWTRILEGWPDPPSTIAPLLASGGREGELWAADERGLHRSSDAGRSWTRVVRFESTPPNLRGLVHLG